MLLLNWWSLHCIDILFFLLLFSDDLMAQKKKLFLLLLHVGRCNFRRRTQKEKKNWTRFNKATYRFNWMLGKKKSKMKIGNVSFTLAKVQRDGFGQFMKLKFDKRCWRSKKINWNLHKKTQCRYEWNVFDLIFFSFSSLLSLQTMER